MGRGTGTRLGLRVEGLGLRGSGDPTMPSWKRMSAEPTVMLHWSAPAAVIFMPTADKHSRRAARSMGCSTAPLSSSVPAASVPLAGGGALTATLCILSGDPGCHEQGAP